MDVGGQAQAEAEEEGGEEEEEDTALVSRNKALRDTGSQVPNPTCMWRSVLTCYVRGGGKDFNLCWYVKCLSVFELI